jgi:CheY-like chemotaxis protein
MIRPSEFLQARILIVDDQASNVQLLQRLLGDAGYVHVDSTMDPHEVVALYHRTPYDLVLLDLHMPGKDGFQVMAELGALDTGGYLPVIVLTAQPGHKLRALEAGAKDFISKPFDLLEVKTRIHNMLEVRLLYRKLDQHNQALEQAVRERTAELRESEERFRRLTELASDWYWEQDENGVLTTASSPIAALFGKGFGLLGGDAGAAPDTHWHPDEHAALQGLIAARQPFLDFILSRAAVGSARRYFRVSGEPKFSIASRFTGYRGIGVEFSPAGSAPATAVET